MATLNLIPNPLVLGTQVGVFLINFVVVKKLFVAPYLRVRDRREALTTGSKDQAHKALADSEALAKRIDERLIASATEAKVEREKLRTEAQARIEKILHTASDEAKRQLAKVEDQIRSDLSEESAKIPGIVTSLIDDVYKLALA